MYVSWAAAQAAKKAGPAAPGSKPVPEPKSMDCLAGLTLVFTGELSSFSREEATELAKRYGARVTLQPSSKTSFIILGDNAGPAKLAAIAKHGLTSLNEDEFLQLIGTRVGPSGPGGQGDEKMRKKQEKDEEAIRKTAEEMEKREREARREEKKRAKEGGLAVKKTVDISSKLWTDRYAPSGLKEMCGNKTSVEKLLLWLQEW
jgi:replication factor C subunit 1